MSSTYACALIQYGYWVSGLGRYVWHYSLKITASESVWSKPHTLAASESSYQLNLPISRCFCSYQFISNTLVSIGKSYNLHIPEWDSYKTWRLRWPWAARGSSPWWRNGAACWSWQFWAEWWVNLHFFHLGAERTHWCRLPPTHLYLFFFNRKKCSFKSWM